MVCSIGSGRMAVMARILAAGSFSQSVPAEVGHQKSISQYIHRELCEADEANLLDEEDMHVYGLMPMDDPLHLVCCNACKKPVKASQYTTHAELCRLLSFEETILEVDGGAGHKKPPRKERKRLLSAHAYQSTVSRDHGRSESIEGDDTVASESHLDEQVGTTSFFSMEAKRHSACVDVAPKMDYSGVSPGFTDHTAGVVPPTKRSKLITAEHLALSDDLETVCGVTKIISQEASTCRDFPKGSSAGIVKCYNHVVGHHNPGHVLECCLPTQDIPVPLATKVFYSQRSNRLQSAISHMYQASAKEYCSDFVTQEMLQGNLMSQQVSSPKKFSIEQINDQPEKKRDTHSLPSVAKPDRSQSSEACLINEGGCPPEKNFASQFPVNNKMRPHTAIVGVLRSKYHSNGYSFAGNSGDLLVIYCCFAPELGLIAFFRDDILVESFLSYLCFQLLHYLSLFSPALLPSRFLRELHLPLWYLLCYIFTIEPPIQFHFFVGIAGSLRSSGTFSLETFFS